MEFKDLRPRAAIPGLNVLIALQDHLVWKPLQEPVL